MVNVTGERRRLTLSRTAVGAVVGLVAVSCGGSDPAATEPAETEPAETEPAETEPAATEPAATDPAATVSESSATTNNDVGDVLGLVCEAELAAGFQQIPCEDMTFDVAVPDVCAASGCGLIVDVHGYTGSGGIAEQHTGMQALGNEAGYVVVQPNNPDNSWDHEVDDDRIRSFMDQLVDGLVLDRDRVHIGGFSQGGWLTWRFVCDHSDLIASAAPAGAGASRPADEPVPGVSCDFDSSSFPAQEVDILYVHGESDPDVPFETALEQRDAVVSAWEMSETSVLVDEPDHRWTRWTSPRGTVFEFLEHDWQGGLLGGHCYPGGSGRVGCGTDTPVAYGEAALQFYIDHPKDQ